MFGGESGLDTFVHRPRRKLNEESRIDFCCAWGRECFPKHPGRFVSQRQTEICCKGLA